MQLTLHIILTFKYCCWYCFFCKAQAPSKSGYAHASHPGQFVLISWLNKPPPPTPAPTATQQTK